MPVWRWPSARWGVSSGGVSPGDRATGGLDDVFPETEKLPLPLSLTNREAN